MCRFCKDTDYKVLVFWVSTCPSLTWINTGDVRPHRLTPMRANSCCAHIWVEYLYMCKRGELHKRYIHTIRHELTCSNSCYTLPLADQCTALGRFSTIFVAFTERRSLRDAGTCDIFRTLQLNRRCWCKTFNVKTKLRFNWEAPSYFERAEA